MYHISFREEQFGTTNGYWLIPTSEVPLTKAERKRLKKIYKHEMVKRHQFFKIAAAWIITVPVSAGLGALLFFTLRGIFIQ